MCAHKCNKVESEVDNSGVTDLYKSCTFEKDEIFNVIGDVTVCSDSFFFQFTFIERESFPTGIDTLRVSAIFANACTPRTKSPFSSAVLVELIQLAEKLILFKASCFTPH